MAKYNFENLSPDEKTKLQEYVESMKEIKKEIKSLLKKAKSPKIDEEGGNMSSGLTLSAD